MILSTFGGYTGKSARRNDRARHPRDARCLGPRCSSRCGLPFYYLFGTARRKPSLAVIAEGSETAAAIAEGGLYIAARGYSARRRYAQRTEIVQLRLSCTIVIERIESPSLGGFPFGTDGQYATIVVTPLAKSTLELQFPCQVLWLEHTTENRDYADRQKRT
jgi:hypothetical protein